MFMVFCELSRSKGLIGNCMWKMLHTSVPDYPSVFDNVLYSFTCSVCMLGQCSYVMLNFKVCLILVGVGKQETINALDYF
uniref:Uncharacterized protein n=1 Tax=Anguilla anguilla TaxID=7936 RepID=A0A0E9XFK8_ANGAN